MTKKPYHYTTEIIEVPENGGAYVRFSWDIRQEFGKGRVKVHATFDGISYQGSIVNMGVRNADGSIGYLLGIPKAIRQTLGKGHLDEVEVGITTKMT